MENETIDVTNSNVCICEAPNYMERLKAKEILERDLEAEDEAVDEVEANVLVEAVQVELDSLVEVEVVTSSLEGISNLEATSSKETTAEVVVSKVILEKVVQSGLVEIGNSSIDAVIDQKELTTTPKEVKSLQPKMSKHAKKRLREKEKNEASAKKINSLIDAVIDQALATTSNQDIGGQPKLS